MKAYTNLTNLDKGKILFDLFPKEIPAITQGLKEYCEFLENDQEKIKISWGENAFISFDMWLQLAKQIISAIDRYNSPGKRVVSSLGSDLFERGYNCLLVIDYLTKHSNSISADPKFTETINLFFSANN